MNPLIFREYDIRGVVVKDLTPDVVKLLGRGIGSYLAKYGASSVSVGRDGRLSSPAISDLLIENLAGVGLEVIDLGIVPTPVSYYSSHRLPIDATIMITGSHNPPDYNGIKITLNKEAIFGQSIQEIREIIEQDDFITSAETGAIRMYDILPEYIDDLAQRLNLSRPVSLALDCGNGVGGLTAGPLLKRLGCDPEMLFDDVDGNFPNHHPDPTVESNLDDLKRVVREKGLELGLAYDGDGDRIGVVDENGNVLWGDQILAILARDLLKNVPGATIIGEVKCSQLLFDDIDSHGGKSLMWKVGHSLLKQKMHETGAELAGEMSGHIFFHHRYYGFDDATYVTGRLLEIIADSDKPLSRLLEDWPEQYNTPEIRRDCPDEIKFKVVEQVRDRFRGQYKVIDVDGMRVIMPGGWGLVRSSNTQPVIVLRFEADSPERLIEIQTEVETVLKEVLEANQ
ncbi:MAG: phosphomannomutase/phosphoglucomutase [Candidatus Electryoneaceae bacterium]|nr:phosphomannomutase/phosphoglucomutase [Candidatus Electryoneaceae bacterium]